MNVGHLQLPPELPLIYLQVLSTPLVQMLGFLTKLQESSDIKYNSIVKLESAVCIMLKKKLSPIFLQHAGSSSVDPNVTKQGRRNQVFEQSAHDTQRRI